MKNNIKSGNWFENRSEVERMHNSLGFNYESSSIVIADQATTNTERFNRLKSAYEKAKLLTPGGNALSSTNRAVVLVPPGIYDAGTDQLVVDTSYVDIVAMVNQKQNKDMSVFDPSATRIISSPTSLVVSPSSAVVLIDADDVRLIGLSIENHGVGVSIFINQEDGCPNNYYENLYLYDFDKTNGFDCWSILNYAGLWVGCCSPSDGAFRMTQGTHFNENVDRYFTATMIDCHGGAYSFGGDYYDSVAETKHEFKGAKFYNCTALGKSFGGCDSFGIGADSDTLFYECDAGDVGRSFCLSAECAATLIRCRGGELCAGANVRDQAVLVTDGSFTGYAEGCVFGKNSLGGWNGDSPEPADRKTSGTIIDCVVTGSENPLKLEGATIRNSIFTNDAENSDCFTLIDGTSVLTGVTALVNSSGTGIPINAASAQDVVAVNCVFNNGANDADGLGANVTNLATTPNNGVY